MVEKSVITLEEYIAKKKFVIPYYQRGYIWGKKRINEKEDDSVTFLTKSIREGYNKGKKLFLQGVTITKPNERGWVKIIDGQQRTTYFYLLLLYLKSKKLFELDYEVRKKTDSFIKELGKVSSREDLLKLCCFSSDDSQDQHFIKKTINTIDQLLNELLEKENSDIFLEYIKKNVKFLLVTLPEDKALDVFTMMNGRRAVMSQEELIKAELLRLMSLDSVAEEWKQNWERSRFAREWDRWESWWNRNEVVDYFWVDETKQSLSFLLRMFMFLNPKSTLKDKKLKGGISFNNFKNEFLNNSNEAFKTFKDLRITQKRFEDIFNKAEDNIKRHNEIGAILAVLKNEREKFLKYYFNLCDTKNDTEIDDYYKLVFLDLRHDEIIKFIQNRESTNDSDNEEETLLARKKKAIKELSGNFVYETENNELAYLQLFRLNIDADTAIGRGFDFSIWKNRSLEHIYPKSKVYHREGKDLYRGDERINSDEQEISKEKTLLNRAEFKGDGSEHCIGNLVLLHKNDNSLFNDSSFEQKKEIYFALHPESRKFYSRNLLHSMSVFASSTWGVEEIQKNRNTFINEMKKFYNVNEDGNNEE